MPGEMQDSAYEMMRGHKQEVRLIRDIPGQKSGDIAMLMQHDTNLRYAELRFEGSPFVKLVSQDDFEPVE